MSKVTQFKSMDATLTEEFGGVSFSPEFGVSMMDVSAPDIFREARENGAFAPDTEALRLRRLQEEGAIKRIGPKPLPEQLKKRSKRAPWA